MKAFTNLEQSKKLTEILPESKMQAYIKYCNEKSPGNIFCDKCNKVVTIEHQYPYFYDKDENDVYFASICPECGELFITKE